MLFCELGVATAIRQPAGGRLREARLYSIVFYHSRFPDQYQRNLGCWSDAFSPNRRLFEPSAGPQIPQRRNPVNYTAPSAGLVVSFQGCLPCRIFQASSLVSLTILIMVGASRAIYSISGLG